MKTVVFLQNMWVKDPVRVRAMIARDGEELRERLIVFALFAGCKTGRVLKKVLTDDEIEAIHWEETTREISGDPKEILPVQLDHIKAVLENQKPDVVLTFGRIAADALKAAGCQAKMICAPHPAARQPDTLAKIQAAVKEWREYMETGVFSSHMGGTFNFNDTVKCVTLSMLKKTPIVGRLVQVRLGCGQFGSEIYFLRMLDGSLQTFENEMIKLIDEDIPKGPDAIGDEYTIKGEWPEKGFVVKNCQKPQTPGHFSMAICSNGVKLTI